MILTLDIETVPNPATFEFLPEPKAAGNIKDPAKIAANIAEKKAAQREAAALDPLTGRVCCYAMVGTKDGALLETARCASDMTDDAEREVVSEIMSVLGQEDTRLVTFNGVGFDMPFIYKRALILDIIPPTFGAPPLTAWTKRYAMDRHYDLMKCWTGWGTEYVSLNELASLILHERKTDIDVTTFAELMKVQEGRDKIAAYCLQDTRLTWRLFEKMQGVLFA